MTKNKYVLWSDIDLDFDDWKDDLQAEYPELSENELLAVMYKINADHLGDERMNLDKQLSQPIIIIGDIGRWDGRVQGYKMIDSGNLKDSCIRTAIWRSGMWTGVVICGVPPYTTMVRIIICIVCLKTVQAKRRSRICKIKYTTAKLQGRILQE